MPIRTPRGRAAAYRSIWQWPLRSPARLLITVVVVAGLAAAVGWGASTTTGGGVARAAPPPPVAGPTVTPTGTPTVTSTALSAPVPTYDELPRVSALQPTTLPVSRAPAAALAVATRWATAWVRPPDGTTAQQWLGGLRATTTEEYLGLLGGVDPANIPATRVTGAARAVRVAPRSVQVDVPTDALTLVLTVIDTDGRGWRVAGSDRA